MTLSKSCRFVISIHSKNSDYQTSSNSINSYFYQGNSLFLLPKQYILRYAFQITSNLMASLWKCFLYKIGIESNLSFSFYVFLISKKKKKKTLVKLFSSAARCLLNLKVAKGLLFSFIFC